jgi:hypothetical protein
MLITPVADALTADGLAAPTLNVLTPDVNNYSVLLLQPHGQIEASAAGVRNRDRALAQDQFGQFLTRAHELQVDLGITPEYFGGGQADNDGRYISDALTWLEHLDVKKGPFALILSLVK